MNTDLLNQARLLPVPEQIELVQALWDEIAQRNASSQAFSLTQAQAAELDRRLAHLKAHPDDVVDWNEVKTQALAQIAS